MFNKICNSKWIKSINEIGIISKSGKYEGGTYAHFDIAMEFASWISPEFKLYIVTEFKRLKEKEQRVLGWNLKRTLSKINYNIHTDAKFVEIYEAFMIQYKSIIDRGMKK